MTNAEILDLIKEAAAFVVPESAEASKNATETSRLTDLGIDSVRALEIAGYVEDRLAANFPDDELATVSSVGDFMALISRHAEAR